VKNEGIILDLEPYGMPKGSIVFRSKDTLDQDESDDSQG